MIFIPNSGSTDPAFNLALEEHCLRKLDPGSEYLLLYINQPSVIIGRHQNPFQEYNQQVVRQRDIIPVRRISGGGAVYHDPGNLNFSFITDFTDQKLDYFKTLLAPIVDTLRHLGVPARMTERNNILVDGKKVSGNSQHTNMRRMLSHGTLLFESELDVLQQVLDSNLKITESRAVTSIKSKVTNICDYLRQPMTVEAFRTGIKGALADAFGEMIEYRISAEEKEAVRRLAEEKYRSWHWTFGRSPEFIVHHKVRLESANANARFKVKNGIIKDIEWADQIAESALVKGYISRLIGEPYDQKGADNIIIR